MKSKELHVLIFLCLLSLVGQTAFGRRKGVRRKSKFEKIQLATTVAPKRSGSCPAPGTLVENLQESIAEIRESLTIEMETRLDDLADLIDIAMREQERCFEEKESEIRESIECEKPSTTITTTTTTTSSPTETSRHGGPPPLPMCDSDNCKDLVSKMLDMIDHSADPCEDFYQYACGGVEKDPHLSPEDPMLDANRRLQNTITTLEGTNPIMGSARTFYDACLQWQQDPESTESLQYARNLVRSVGWFLPIKSSIRIDDDSVKPLPQHTDLTSMLATFMLSHFAPFFDISLEPDASQNDQFLPKISLPFSKNELSKEIDHWTCISEFDKKVWNTSFGGGPSLDLNEEYERYQTCKNTDGLNAKLSRMEEAVKKLDLLHYVHEEDRAELLLAIRQDTEILLHAVGEKVREQVKFKSIVLNKNYQINVIEDLTNLLGDQINWKEFFQILTGKTLKSDQKVIVYHQKELGEVLTIIGREWSIRPKHVHNTLLMMWSEWVYSAFVSPLEPPENYCVEATKVLLPDISSALYLHSFPDVHLTRAQNKMRTKVKTIQNTFSSMFLEDEDIKTKINSAVVNVGSFFDAASRNQSLMDSTKGMNLNSSHVYNMGFLLKRFRQLMYKLLGERTNSPRAMWIKGIVPFEKRGFYVHETNHVFLPFGTFFPPYFYFRKFLPEYVSFGGIGHLVAEQFLNMIDGTGKDFNGKIKTTLNIPSRIIYTTECIADQLLPEFTVQDKNVRGTYKMPIQNFKLNDVISFSGATTLSWKAYLTSQHDSTGPLPSLIESPEDSLIWLGEKPLQPIKSYFLRVAQTQCSTSRKIDLLDIMESEKMLPRHKVNFILRNDALFSEAFECPKHSPMNQQEKCSFLPYHQ